MYSCYGEEECLIDALCYNDETCIANIKDKLNLQQQNQELEDFPFKIGVVLNGLNNVPSSNPTYCDHEHLYSFHYGTVTLYDAGDSTSDLDVVALSMTFFN